MTRSAPALGLATASIMITMVGLGAIRYAGHPGRADYLGALVTGDRPTSSVPATSPSHPMPARTAARPVAAPHTGGPAARPSRSTASSTARPAATSTRLTPSPGPLSSIAGVSSGVSGNSANLASSSNQAYARAVFQAVNEARAGQHLPALAWSPQLQQSAHQHNLTMAAANTLSHQVGAEPDLGSRIDATGLQWQLDAENIGWTTAQSRSGALGIEASMFAETPPSDAHRQNILSSKATLIGIDVLIDNSHGRLWLTEDFAG
ncbi:MAG TPA: CAP domain-containing protein [Jatrophihabitans sp.]|nr:CAP domain-containing protein [Jatrophihabitans sp.]